jgi:hypothetical protein
MTFNSKVENLLSWSLLKIWVANTKVKEKALGAKVKTKLTGSGDDRTLSIVCKTKREILWQIEAKGSYRQLAEAVLEVDDKNERPSEEWYKTNTP